MTKLSKELLAEGHTRGAGMRKWRRERGLTMRSMAHMLGCCEWTLHHHETGKFVAFREELDAAYTAFVKRWETVPAFRERLEREVHRTKMRYRAAALERHREREVWGMNGSLELTGEVATRPAQSKK